MNTLDSSTFKIENSRKRYMNMIWFDIQKIKIRSNNERIDRERKNHLQKKNFQQRDFPNRAWENHCHKFGHNFAVQEPFKPTASKNKLNPLLDDLSCLIKNQISYEDITQETCGYPENQKELEAYIVSLREDKFA